MRNLHRLVFFLFLSFYAAVFIPDTYYEHLIVSGFPIYSYLAGCLFLLSAVPVFHIVGRVQGLAIYLFSMVAYGLCVAFLRVPYHGAFYSILYDAMQYLSPLVAILYVVYLGEYFRRSLVVWLFRLAMLAGVISLTLLVGGFIGITVGSGRSFDGALYVVSYVLLSLTPIINFWRISGYVRVSLLEVLMSNLFLISFILISQTRSLSIVYLMCVAVYFYMYRKKFLLITTVACSSLLFIFLYLYEVSFVSNSSLLGRFTQNREGGMEGEERVLEATGALDALAGNMLFGNGIGALFYNPLFGRYTGSAHLSPVALLLKGGVIYFVGLYILPMPKV